MIPRSRSALFLFFLILAASMSGWASAYNGRPKLVVVIIVDQMRADYLDRVHDRLGPNGFRLLMDRGAYFSNTEYEYATLRTAPGHATLATGAYTDGHGIVANTWWDPVKKKSTTSVADDRYRIAGLDNPNIAGASPLRLQASTIGDELRFATNGASRVFAISLKDRASVMPAGMSGQAYWIDPPNGEWVTSTYYRAQLPDWAKSFNASGRREKYWDQQWKDASGRVLRTTSRNDANGKPTQFYETVGETPFGIEYELDFARELITNEKLGSGPTTDLLFISLSSLDILGHEAGPDSPEVDTMMLAIDKQLGDFFGFLGKQYGLANIWVALSADHGIAPTVASSRKLGFAVPDMNRKDLLKKINAELSTRLNKQAEYVPQMEWPVAFLNQDAFAAVNLKEADAERMVGDILGTGAGMRGYYTRAELDRNTPNDPLGRRYAHSTTRMAGWYVMGVPDPFNIGGVAGTDHATPWSYDRHVPLAFFGMPFKPGTYVGHAEPVDLAVTLAALLHINMPTAAVGRVLTEALAPSTARAEAAAGER